MSELTWGAYDSLKAKNAELQEEIGHLEDSLIKQGQMLRDIVNITKGPPVDKMHSTHDAVESVERLKARVSKLERQAVQGSDDEEARFNQVVFLVEALRQSTHGKEVIEQASGNQIMDVELRDYLEDFGLLPVSCERLRNDADKAGGEQCR